MKHYDDDVVAQMLVAARKVRGTKVMATKLQQEL